MTTELATDPYRLAFGEGIADIWWRSGRLTVKTGAAVGNSFLVMEVDDPRGTATPMHVHHDQDEAFYILDGEVVVFVDDRRLELTAGAFALVPRGTVHAYLVRSEHARMLVTQSPAGLEEAFVAAGTPVTSPEPPAEQTLPSAAEMTALLADYGLEVVGPPPSLADL
jgi:quercetin dioxygenase-like cupin family protein